MFNEEGYFLSGVGNLTVKEIGNLKHNKRGAEDNF